MKKIILALAMLLGTSAFAETMRCTGKYVVYSVEAIVKLKGQAIASPIQVNITGPFGMKHQIKMIASKANIELGQHIQIDAVGPEGEGTLSVDAAPIGYKGSFSANTPMGSGHIAVECQISKPAWYDFFGV